MSRGEKEEKEREKLEEVKAYEGDVILHTDSEYLWEFFHEIVHKYRLIGYQSFENRKTMELLRDAYFDIKTNRNFYCVKVKSHNENPYNDTADSMAKEACELAKREVSVKYFGEVLMLESKRKTGLNQGPRLTKTQCRRQGFKIEQSQTMETTTVKPPATKSKIRGNRSKSNENDNQETSDQNTVKRSRNSPRNMTSTVLNTKKHKNKDSIPEPSRTVSPNTIILEKARSNHSQKKRLKDTGEEDTQVTKGEKHNESRQKTTEINKTTKTLSSSRSTTGNKKVNVTEHEK